VSAWRPVGCAAGLFAAGVRQAEVARQLEVSVQAVSVWHARWKQGGVEALRSRGPSGPPPRLSDAQLATVEAALLQGATANGFTGELRRFVGGEKATLLWDGLPSHRSTAMGAWLNRQRSWLVVERLPAYAPELNPVEGLWSSLKTCELANLSGPTLAEVIDQAHRGIQRVRQTPHLAYSFLRRTGLSVA
jgi:DDE superfamily endonuclease/Winged helix-turn helix